MERPREDDKEIDEKIFDAGAHQPFRGDGEDQQQKKHMNHSITLHIFNIIVRTLNISRFSVILALNTPIYISAVKNRHLPTHGTCLNQTKTTK